MDLVAKAKEFATRAHEGQLRKWTGEPYIVHPEAVAKRVELAGEDLEAIDAAWLHDVVEDCGVTLDQITSEFGSEVSGLVGWCSDKYTSKDYPHLNRAKRKQLEMIRLLDIPPAAACIKMADFLDNFRTIRIHDEEFAKTYATEKLMVMGCYASAILNDITYGERELVQKLYEECFGAISEFLRAGPLLLEDKSK